MAKKKINKVYLTLQPTPMDASTSTGEGTGTVVLGTKPVISGEFSKYGDGEEYSFENEKLSSMRVMTGNGKSTWTALKSMLKHLPLNGQPYMLDSRDGGVKIHNHNFGQSTKLFYTYAGGNGELLKASFKVQKKAKPLDLTSSSKIDPETKSVTTSVKQNIDVPRRPTYQAMSEEDRNQRGLNMYWRPEGIIDHNYGGGLTLGEVQKTITRGKQNKVVKLTETQRQRILASQYKFSKEASDEISQNYKVTVEDRDNYFKQVKATWESGLAEAKSTGNLEPLLKSNSIGKFKVIKKVRVKEWINPFDYSNRPGTDKAVVTEYDGFGSYKHGLDIIKSNPNIVLLDKVPQKKVVAKSQFENPARGASDGYRYGPAVLGLVDKEIEVEIDGARIFASATPQEAADLFSDHDLISTQLHEVVGTLSTVGRPSLITSMVVALRNVSQKYSGRWYTKKVKHLCSPGSGYLCEAEVIRCSGPIAISTTSSRIHTPSIFNEINKVAKEKIAQGNSVDTRTEVTQKLKEFYANPKDKIKPNTNVGVTVEQTKKGEVYKFYPASEQVTNIREVRDAERTKKK